MLSFSNVSHEILEPLSRSQKRREEFIFCFFVKYLLIMINVFIIFAPLSQNFYFRERGANHIFSSSKMSIIFRISAPCLKLLNLEKGELSFQLFHKRQVVETLKIAECLVILRIFLILFREILDQFRSNLKQVEQHKKNVHFKERLVEVLTSRKANLAVFPRL